MTSRQSTLAKIEATCQKANPNLLKLEFGCLLIVKNYNNKMAIIVSRKLSKNNRMCLLFEGKDQVESGWVYIPEYFEILGKEPGLADVLLAVDQYRSHLVSPPEYQNYKHYSYAPDGRVYYDTFGWDLTKGLYAQKDETLTFLASLLETK